MERRRTGISRLYGIMHTTWLCALGTERKMTLQSIIHTDAKGLTPPRRRAVSRVLGLEPLRKKEGGVYT